MHALIYILLGAVMMAAIFWSRARYADFLAQRPEDYAAGVGNFDIRTHLNGPILCEGVVYGPMGRVSSRFVGEFACHWDGDQGRMDEVFTYDDGSTQERCWRLSLSENGQIKALADDVVGEGTGQQMGSAVRLNYKFRLPESAGGHILDTVDWMYLAPNGTIVNRSQFRKFGIKVAELVATMRPVQKDLKDAA